MRFLICTLLLVQTGVFFSQMPNAPDIAWMATEYELTDGSVDVTFSWDMWWGENGDHWKLIQDGVSIFESDIIPNIS